MPKEVDKRFKPKTGPKKPPDVIMLPGGKVVRSYDFRITRVDAEGRPTTFELAEPGSNSDCVLWAHDVFMEARLPIELMTRYESRLDMPTRMVSNMLNVQPVADVDTAPYEKIVEADPHITQLIRERVGEVTKPVSIEGRWPTKPIEPGGWSDFPRQHMGRPVDWVCGKCGNTTRNLSRNECNGCGEPV